MTLRCVPLRSIRSATPHGKSLEQFSESVRLKPQLVEAQLNFGIALLRSGRQAEAIAAFEEALRLKPGDPTALKYLQQLLKAPQP